MKLLIPILNLLIFIPVLAGNTDDPKQEAPPLETLHGQILDISSDEKDDVAYIERKILDSIDYQQIRAKYNVKVTKIVEGYLNIWENPVKSFSSAAVVYDYGEPRLMYVEESENGGKKFFAKIFSTWTPITDNDYNERVKAIRDQIPIMSQFGLNLRFVQENPKYLVEKYAKEFVNLFIFTPTKHHRVKVVHEGKNILWKSEIPTERCPTIIAYSKGIEPILVHLFVVSDYKPMSSLYMKKVDEAWVNITEEEFNKESISFKYSKSSFTPITLDIENVDSSLFEVEPRTFEKPYFKYVPKPGYKITTVMEGDNLIWKSQDETLFFGYGVGHFNKGGPPIVQVFVNYNAPKFRYNYVKNGTKWEQTSEFSVDNRFYTMQGERYKILDVSAINPNEASIIELSMNKVRYMLITPKMGYDIMMIRDTNQTIWKYEGLEGYFVNGWLYFSQNEPVLLHFRVRNPLMEHEEFYFVKRDGYWDRAMKEEYIYTLNSITEASKKKLSGSEEDEESVSSSKDYDEKFAPSTPTSSEGPDSISEAGFKQRLYDQYGVSSYEPLEDEDITKVISSGDARAPGYPKFSYHIKHSTLDTIPEWEEPTGYEDAKMEFDHLEPYQVSDYIDLGKRDISREHYKSTGDLHETYEEEFDPKYKSFVRRSKSVRDLTQREKKQLRTEDDEEESDDDERKKLLADKRKRLRKPDSAYIPTTALIVLVSMLLSFV